MLDFIYSLLCELDEYDFFPFSSKDSGRIFLQPVFYKLEKGGYYIIWSNVDLKQSDNTL